MKILKVIIFVFFSLLLSTIIVAGDDHFNPTGWNELKERGLSEPETAQYFSPFSHSSMYQQRDYFKDSEYGFFTSQIYNYWDDVVFNTTTVSYYVTFFQNYNSKINQLMYASDPGREFEVFVDQELYDSIVNTLDYHAPIIREPSFQTFRSDVIALLDQLLGLTFSEAREVFFPGGSSCTPAMQQAHYC